MSRKRIEQMEPEERKILVESTAKVVVALITKSFKEDPLRTMETWEAVAAKRATNGWEHHREVEGIA